MKMVKSLLLGSAATLVAAAGAQAADLPMKAKAVEYVKVCSLYGAGFYYIPGTDTCIKIGGYVRAEYVFNGAGSGANVYLTGTDSYYNAAQTRYYNWYSRYVGTIDVRSQTEYGTLRSYARVGAQYNTGAQGSGDTESMARAGDGHLYFDRAFIQFAGFTFGKINSLMEFWGSYGVSNMTARGTPDTGGLTVAYYTAMLGNGVSATIGVEDPNGGRRYNIFNYNANSNIMTTFGTAYGNNYGGTEIPDIIGDLRVSQAWGTAAVTGIAHQVRAGFYGTAFPGTTAAGPPGDKWGYAVTGGLDLNLPWAKGDHFVVQGSYAVGAIAQMRTGTRLNVWEGGNSVTNLVAVDAVFATPGAGPGGIGGNLELTTGWSVIAGLEHYWMPNLRSSIWGDYAAIRYNGNAKALLCNSATGVFAGQNNAFGGNAGTCNPDFNQYTLAGRTIWNPVPNLDIGLEVAYTKYEQNHAGTTAVNNVAALPAGNYAFGDYDVWAVNFRVQRNFWP